MKNKVWITVCLVDYIYRSESARKREDTIYYNFYKIYIHVFILTVYIKVVWAFEINCHIYYDLDNIRDRKKQSYLCENALAKFWDFQFSKYGNHFSL